MGLPQVHEGPKIERKVVNHDQPIQIQMSCQMNNPTVFVFTLTSLVSISALLDTSLKPTHPQSTDARASVKNISVLLRLFIFGKLTDARVNPPVTLVYSSHLGATSTDCVSYPPR